MEQQALSFKATDPLHSFVSMNGEPDALLNSKGYLSVQNPSVTDTGDTPITQSTDHVNVLGSDDELDDDETETATEFMEDDEHRATMLKLYHPRHNAKHDSHDSQLQPSYTHTEQSISPELLTSTNSTSEPPVFEVTPGGAEPQNLHNGTAAEQQQPIRPEIVDFDYANTESRISTSLNFDNIVKIDTDRKFNFGLQLEPLTPLKACLAPDDDIDDAHAGFLDDDTTHNTHSTHNADGLDAVHHRQSKESRQSKVRKQSKQSGCTKNSRSRSRSKRTRGNSRAQKQPSISITISRTNSEASQASPSRSSSFANLKACLPPSDETRGGVAVNDDNSNTDDSFEDIDYASFPVTATKKAHQHRRGKSMEVRSTTASEYVGDDAAHYIGRPVPIIRRVASVQNPEHAQHTTDDDDDDDDATDDGQSRLFAPQTRYLSISVSKDSNQRPDISKPSPAVSIPQPRASKVEKRDSSEHGDANKPRTRRFREKERGSRGSKKVRNARGDRGAATKYRQKGSVDLAENKRKRRGKKDSKEKRTRHSDEHIERTRSRTRAQTRGYTDARHSPTLDLMRAHSHNPTSSHKRPVSAKKAKVQTSCKHMFNAAPRHNYNHYTKRGAAAKKRPSTTRYPSQRDSGRSSAQFTFDTDGEEEDEDDEAEDDDDSFYSNANSSERDATYLDGVLKHFWKVIDIANNGKIPFEILKISLRVKNIAIKENNWDILLNELTNFQPSKNITLRMFKDFVLDRKSNSTHYYRVDQRIVDGIREQLIDGLVSDHRPRHSNASSGHSGSSRKPREKAKKPKLSNKFSSSNSKKSRKKKCTYYDDDSSGEECAPPKMKTIKFNIIPAKPKLTAKRSNKPPKAQPLKHKRSFSGSFGGFAEDASVDFMGHSASRIHAHQGIKRKRKRETSNSGRGRSTSHQSYLQSSVPGTVRSSSCESGVSGVSHGQSAHNASQYLKYSIQQSMVSSLLECVENGSLRQAGSSRFRGYCAAHEWRKALKYLLRCHFLLIADGEEVFPLEQFKFALYDQCDIRYDFGHDILPILAFKQHDRQHFVVTQHSFVEWMLQHLDQMLKLRRNQGFHDQNLEKLLAIVCYKERRKDKRKAKSKRASPMDVVNPFIAVSPSFKQRAPGGVVDRESQLRLEKAQSMNVASMHRHVMEETPTTTTSTTTTELLTGNLHIGHLRSRQGNGKQRKEARYEHLKPQQTRHHYSTSHGQPPAAPTNNTSQQSQFGYRRRQFAV